MSNYHSFGHLKFIPDLTPEKFWGILGSHPENDDSDSLFYWAITTFKFAVDKEIFAYD